MANSGFRDACQKLVEAGNKYLGRNFIDTIAEDIERFTKTRNGTPESIANECCLNDRIKETMNDDE